MKKILLILVSIIALASCSKTEPWSSEGDNNDYFEKHPYGLVFENGTTGEIIIECDDLSTNIIILKQGAKSDTYYIDKPDISISYNGEGTEWTTIHKYVKLKKNQITTVTIAYP